MLVRRSEQESVFRCWWSGVLNWKSDRTRGVYGVGPPWRMYQKLARRLVDDGRWFMIPLYSGMQVPLLDAVDYLAEVSDHASAPSIERLFERYAPTSSVGSDQSYQWRGFNVINSYGPADYIPLAIQNSSVSALLKLFSVTGAKEFVKEVLVKSDVSILGRDTLGTMVAFAVENRMSEISSFLLDAGKRLKDGFEERYKVFLQERVLEKGTGISWGSLYGYETLVYGAYQLAAGDEEKEVALQILITEYNHPDADGLKRSRPHDHINFILCRIIDRDLIDDCEEGGRVKSLLNSVHFENDMRLFKEKY